MTTLIPIFADQLSFDLSSLTDADKETCIIVMMEVREEADTVWHHRKKMIFLFSAMRHFAAELTKQGFTVDYIKMDDPGNKGNFTDELKRAVKRHKANALHVCEPSEYRVLKMAQTWERTLGVSVDIRLDNRFLATKKQFSDWAKNRKQLRMEYFYREMRRKTGLLMNGDEPEGAKWNYDSENRKPADNDLFMPQPLKFKPDEVTKDVIEMVTKLFPDRFGAVDEFFYGVTREDALAVLNGFVNGPLRNFGDYQDAMLTGQPFLYHSILSLYLNVGLLNPLEICRAVEEAYKKDKAPLNAAEGYIRQIIGWREYVRGVYWYFMPDYLEENALGATRPLPEFYWSGETDMHCLSEAIGQTIDHGYAHHIQRLMITGNFALVTGVSPQELHEWYLAVYVDAFEWVELPNTLGMSQFGDGGKLASKPYASSGSYINRMSDYCQSCRYDVKKRTGDKACPFNSLYWDFVARNEGVLKGNPRMGLVYRNLEKMDADTLKDLRAQAATFLESLS